MITAISKRKLLKRFSAPARSGNPAAGFDSQPGLLARCSLGLLLLVFGVAARLCASSLLTATFVGKTNIDGGARSHRLSLMSPSICPLDGPGASVCRSGATYYFSTLDRDDRGRSLECPSIVAGCCGEVAVCAEWPCSRRSRVPDAAAR